MNGGQEEFSQMALRPDADFNHAEKTLLAPKRPLEAKEGHSVGRPQGRKGRGYLL